MNRVWLYGPEWEWFGWRDLWLDLVPLRLGGDEWGRRTVMLGWAVTGRVVVAVSRPGRLYPPDADLMSDWGCCSLDEGHDGACTWVCSGCDGTGRCPDCDGVGGLDDVVRCDWCDGSGACPEGCYEGMVSDE